MRLVNTSGGRHQKKEEEQKEALWKDRPPYSMYHQQGEEVAE